MNELAKVYEEIAMERPHVCTGCGSKDNLSHSHLVPKAHDSKLKTVKENITYHCLVGKDCHHKWESIAFWQLKDARKNMEYIYSVRPDYFWLKLNHAIDAYFRKPTTEENTKAMAALGDLITIVPITVKGHGQIASPVKPYPWMK